MTRRVQIEAIVSKLPAGRARRALPAVSGGARRFAGPPTTRPAAPRSKLDDEQLPYASRHYITTQRFIRIADDDRELTVACPDAPLWQIGGFTFGRFGDPDGRVAREHPTLLAWLTNNYWSTNFQADQGGEIRFRFCAAARRRSRISGKSVAGRARPASIRWRRTSMPSAAPSGMRRQPC